jgi:predicted DNA-binding protein (MmcQ/YjbR family)
MQPSLVLRRVRALVRQWQNVVETESWGHPNWQHGGRQFASFDTYGGKPAICFKTSPDIQAKLVLRPHFLLAPYAASRGWVCRTLEEPLDWTKLARLLKDAHALVAPPAKSKPRRNPKRPARGRVRVSRG